MELLDDCTTRWCIHRYQDWNENKNNYRKIIIMELKKKQSEGERMNLSSYQII